MTDHENELRKTECGARFETASGEPVSPCYLPKGHIGDHRGTCLGSQCVWAHGVEREEEMTHVNNSHENELDRLRRQNATLRIRLQQRLCCEPDGAPDEVFRYCDQCKADINALSYTAGSEYISKAVSDEMAKQILASAAMTEELRQKVFILRVALEACESPRRDCRNSDACLCVRCSAIRQTKLDGQPLDYISKESVKPLVEALRGAEVLIRCLAERNGASLENRDNWCRLKDALALAKSLGIPTEKESA